MPEIQQELIIKFLLSIASSFRKEGSAPRSGSSKDPTNRYIKNPQTHPKASLGQKGLGAGRKFTRKVSKSNTLPIQIYLTLVETSGGMTSVGLWSRSLSPVLLLLQSSYDIPVRISPGWQVMILDFVTLAISTNLRKRLMSILRDP